MSYIEYAAFLVTVVWYCAVVRLGVFWQPHHYHLGMLVFALAGDGWLAWAGVALAAEDMVQHVVQCWRPRFRSPINRLYGRFIWPLLPKWAQKY